MYDGWYHLPHIVDIKDRFTFGELRLSRTPAPPGTCTAPAAVEEPGPRRPNDLGIHLIPL